MTAGGGVSELNAGIDAGGSGRSLGTSGPMSGDGGSGCASGTSGPTTGCELSTRPCSSVSEVTLYLDGRCLAMAILGVGAGQVALLITPEGGILERMRLNSCFIR